MLPILLTVSLAAFAPIFVPQTARAVPQLDLKLYAGRWHEVARFPNRFQKQCLSNVAADYSVRPDGQITVINSCEVKGGGTERAEGLARKANVDGPASILKVRFAPKWLSFLPMVWGDYWVVALAGDYRYAVVGSPDHDYLWILSRTPSMSATDYAAAVDGARANGFDTSRLVKTPASR